MPIGAECGMSMTSIHFAHRFLELASAYRQKDSRPAHLIVWTPWRGGCAGTPGASAHCARRAPSPAELPSRLKPKTGRSAGTNTDPTRSSPPPPHPQPFLPAVGHSDRPSAAGAPPIRPPSRATVSRARRPPPARAPNTRASTRGDSIPWERRHPPRSSHTAAASRRTPRAAATPPGASELAKRLECARSLSDFFLEGR